MMERRGRGCGAATESQQAAQLSATDAPRSGSAGGGERVPDDYRGYVER